ncbi:MAG TPA: ATP-dependent zinc metalloprotease FtsH [Gaiellaceae bacterium]|nr:ATP-dependent zinc metalloprotease FtsH [Gaiellaceae bacterium]
MQDESRQQRARASAILLALLLAFLVAQLFLFPLALAGRPEALPYSRFLDLVEQGSVERAAIGEEQVSGVYRRGGREVEFVTLRPPGVDDQALLRALRAQDVEFSGLQPSPLAELLGQILQWVVPLALIVGVWVWLMRRYRPEAGAMTLGRSRHKVYDRKDLRTTFADVAGVDEAVEELREVVDFLKNPKRYSALGGKIPKGVLLVGPPGTGKTLLARAVAGEAGVPFFFLSGSEFVELFVGLGAARVRDLFQEAKQKAPCIVFIDEIDTIGKARGGAVSGSIGAHDEREQTLNQLLTEMDGFDPSAGVIIMAATNRPEVLDPALLRPGRFDRRVVVDRPDRRGREAILRVHARGVKLAPDVDLSVIAARTPGFAGAELANVVNEAALLAARRGKQAVGMEELEEAIDRVSIGLERRSRVLSPRERERVAYHELGHAFVALACPHADPVHRVSIIPRGVGALGVTQQLPADDRYLITEPELRDRLAVMMGGRAAERLVYGDLSTGAQNDLQQATALARRMVEEFGMSEEVGPLALARPGLFLPVDGGRPEALSPELAAAADREVRRLLEEAEARAEALLAERREALDRLARLLLERETLEGAELRAALEETGAAATPA